MYNTEIVDLSYSDVSKCFFDLWDWEAMTKIGNKGNKSLSTKKYEQDKSKNENQLGDDM